MARTGWLHGWRLTFAGEGHRLGRCTLATVVEDPDSKVFVVLYHWRHRPDEMNSGPVGNGSELGLAKKIRCRIDRESFRTIGQRDPVLAWLYVRCRGKVTVGATRRHGGRRGRLRAHRLCPRHPDQAPPQHRSRNLTADRLRSSRPVRRCWSAPAPRSPTRALIDVERRLMQVELRTDSSHTPTAPSHRAPPRGTGRSPPCLRTDGCRPAPRDPPINRVGGGSGSNALRSPRAELRGGTARCARFPTGPGDPKQSVHKIFHDQPGVATRRPDRPARVPI